MPKAPEFRSGLLVLLPGVIQLHRSPRHAGALTPGNLVVIIGLFGLKISWDALPAPSPHLWGTDLGEQQVGTICSDIHLLGKLPC